MNDLNTEDRKQEAVCLSHDILRMLQGIIDSEKATITQQLAAAKEYRSILAELNRETTDCDSGPELLAFIAECNTNV